MNVIMDDFDEFLETQIYPKIEAVYAKGENFAIYVNIKTHINDIDFVGSKIPNLATMWAGIQLLSLS